jgi:23S rRNA pseudouridine1911/1915/1917 synthase
MPRTETGWLITPEELRSWLVDDAPDYAVVNKPGDVVCHPSKSGPWSSLVGAAREYFGLDRVHPVFRLDRETSGVVVLAKTHETASRLQRAVERRRVRKTYLAVLEGHLNEPVRVDRPLRGAAGSRVWIRQEVCEPGQGSDALSEFVPLAASGGLTLVRVHPHTGRLHQIRVHAASIGHPVAGDKIYGPDETLFLEFIAGGLTPRLKAALPIVRQALHASRVVFELPGGDREFRAPLAGDIAKLCRERMGIDAGQFE